MVSQHHHYGILTNRGINYVFDNKVCGLMDFEYYLVAVVAISVKVSCTNVHTGPYAHALIVSIIHLHMHMQP